MRRLIALVAVSGLTVFLAGCGGSSPSWMTHSLPAPSPTASAQASSAPAVLNWGSCPSSVEVEGAQCAALKVPLDYSDPDGQQITLELSRVLHTSSASQYLGVMLSNPGGPGASGLSMAGNGAQIANGVGGRFDWIGWDPRGVGASKPELTCDQDYFDGDRPSYTDPADRQVWLKRAADYAKACGQDQPELLKNMTTADNARDMDMIRRALGVQKISYYGFSWGSYLGQMYMTLFPTHVNRVVLDGVVNPKVGWYQANFDQDAAFQKSIEIFFAWVAANDSVYHLGTTEAAVYAAYSNELAKLAKTPAENGQLGPDELTDTVLQGGYYAPVWAEIASALADLVNSDNGSEVWSVYEQVEGGASGENNYAVYNAVQCTDMKWPGWQQTLTETEKVAATAPFETWSNTWYNAPCLTWPAPAQPGPAIAASPSLPKILLIAETNDAATPFSGALAARALFPTSSLIEGVGGTTHAGSLDGVPCTEDAVASYLATGVTPARLSGDVSDLQCPKVPAPAAQMY